MTSPVPMRSSFATAIALVVTSILAAIGGADSAYAQTNRTWTGGGADANWGTGGNWTVPLTNNFNNLLVFDGSTKTTNTNTLTGGTATGITFSDGASPFTISGSAVTLAGNVVNSSTNLQTINLDLALTGASRNFSMTAGGGNLVIAGAISGTTNIAFQGSGTATFSGNNASYSGTTTLSVNRNVIVGHNNALGTGVVNWSQIAKLDVTPGNSFTSPANLVLAATGSMEFRGSGNLEFTGTTSFGITSNRQLTVSSGTLTLGTIAGSTNASMSKTGAGTLVFAGPVSTVPAMTISAGTALVNGNFSSLTSGTVAAGATLGGNGSLSGTATVDGTLTPGSRGSDTGLLSLTDLLLGPSSLTQIDITGTVRGTSFDALNVANSLTYSGSLAFNMPTLLTGTFDIFDFSTLQSGDLTSVTGLLGSEPVTFTNTNGVWTAPLASGTLAATFTQATGALVIAVPEPTALAFIGCGVSIACFAVRGHRRMRRADSLLERA